MATITLPNLLPDPSAAVSTSSASTTATAAASTTITTGGSSVGTHITDQSSLPLLNPGNLTQGLDMKQLVLTFSNLILSNLLLISGVLAVIFLLFAGIRYITAAGDPIKAKAARGAIINVVIGVIIIIAAFSIIKFAVGVGDLLGSSTSGA
jgi:arginine exporter protein ArgO